MVNKKQVLIDYDEHELLINQESIRNHELTVLNALLEKKVQELEKIKVVRLVRHTIPSEDIFLSWGRGYLLQLERDIEKLQKGLDFESDSDLVQALKTELSGTLAELKNKVDHEIAMFREVKTKWWFRLFGRNFLRKL